MKDSSDRCMTTEEKLSSIMGYEKLIEQHQKYIDEYQKRIVELRSQAKEREQG